MGVLSGSRRRGETEDEAGGWQDSWCAGHRSVHPGVQPAVLVRIVLVRILVQLVLAPIPVSTLGQNARIPILLVWSEKKQAGVRKGVLLVEQSPQDDRTRGHLVSAGPFDRWVGRSVG
jgi:hypothetical protein